eukprot:1799871-Prymnesium_polylepis.1
MSEASARRRRAARLNGSVLPAYVERLRHGSPAELYGPSRLQYACGTREVFCTYLRTSEPRRQRA